MEKYLKNNYKNIAWISVFDSKKPGKNIWILAINHWDEKVWLEVFSYLENEFDIWKKLKNWKVFFIALNLKAYEKNTRFIDENMNRIWKNMLNKNSYESKRFYELKEIFDEIDVFLDLHSVSIWDEKMLIIDKEDISLAKKIFDGKYFLVDNIWETSALIWDFIRNWKKAFWIECWNHNSKDAFKSWVKNTLNLLSYYKNITNEIERENLENIFLNFWEEIYAKGNNFKFTKEINWFELIKKWEIYAKDDENIYKNNFDFDIYLWLISKNISKNDWCWFIFFEQKKLAEG